ncbi:response regulator [Fibrella arboris]|uniref:response regulator n=1 Tax=Fibrella arboris TaxID=3242486 RepID=UPI0035208381
MNRPCIFLRQFLMVGFVMACLPAGMAQPRQEKVPGLTATNPPYIVQVRHFSIEQGLPNRSVVDIGQDAQGFIWIGTLNNAYRFDGNRFMALPNHASSGKGQLTAYVDRISQDQAGTLWFFKIRSGFDQWIERWLPHEQRSVAYTVRPEDALAAKHHFYAAETIDQRGGRTKPGSSLVFFRENGRVYRYRSTTGLTSVYTSPGSALVGTVAVTASGNLLVPVSDTTDIRYSLVELDSLGRQRRQQPLPKHLLPVCTDAQGGIYLAQKVNVQENAGTFPQLTAHQLTDFLYRLDANGKLTSLPIHFARSPFPALAGQTSTIPVLMHTRVVYDAYHDLFWFLGRNVLFAWHPEKGVVYDLMAADSPAAQIPGFSSLRVDRTGGVWVGSSNGVLLLTLTPNQFVRYLYWLPGTSGYSDAATRGLTQVGNSLWVNAFDSWLVDLKTGARQLALPRPRIQQTDFLGQMPVAPAGNGALWTANSKLSLVWPATQTVVQYPLLRSASRCSALLPDGRGNLWIGYDQGISYFDVALKRNIPFTRYNNWPELAENRVNGFFPDRRAGGLWVAASSGLYLLDTLRGIVARYSVEQPAPRNLPFNHITYVHADPDQPGRYWLATRGGGLIRWERETGRYRQFTQADGLLNATLYCVYTDHPDPAKRFNRNRLWFTTDYGLVSFDKKTEHVQTYLPKDGLTHEEFNFTSHYQAPDGRLFLGGLNGVTAFWPKQIQTGATTKAPLVLTQFQQLDGQTGIMENHLTDYQLGQPLQIASSSRAFLLAFALLDYRYLGQTRLWYRIRGWQDAWATQKQNDLRINGLPSGDYQLEVRMQSISGQWISNTLSIPVVVQPPVYKRWWFVVLGLLTLLGATAAVFRWRNSRLVQETIRLEAEVANRTNRIKEDKAIIEQQAAELRENATLKSRFFANVTHEFRTPLTLLLGPITYLAKHTDDATAQRLVRTMERNARQLQELVDDLLGLGKLEAGQLQLDSQPADLLAVVARTVAAFATQATLANISLETQGLDGPIGMMLDVPKVETVLRNLIANALRFTPGGGTIHVQLTDTPDQVRIAIADTGRGIHPDDLPHVVERYYQSKRPDTPLQGGTGIGLALCQEYCQLWQGELLIESTLGEGSTFTFTYPKIAISLPEKARSSGSDDQVPTTEAVSESTLTADYREAILIVEDNPDMAGYIQLVLAPHYAHHWCRNGREALAWLSRQPANKLPHLIVTDMMMPEMDGMTLLEKLQQQPDFRPIPVIMLTARFSQEVRIKALQLGIADYLTKPFNEEELVARIQNLLDRARERAFWIMPAATGSGIHEETPESAATSVDDDWLQRIQALIIANLTDSRFQVNDLAEATNMSQRHFYRRVKTLTGLSPIQFVQEVRLQMAHEWIESTRYTTVKEVAHRVGFQKVSYFSRLYHQRFGVHPGLNLNQHGDSIPA